MSGDLHYIFSNGCWQPLKAHPRLKVYKELTAMLVSYHTLGGVWE